VIRNLIWTDPGVRLCYQQNTVLFASAAAIADSPALKSAAENVSSPQLELIAESTLARLTSFSGVMLELFPATRRMVGRRLRRLGIIR
jgi:hypothetical protein